MGKESSNFWMAVIVTGFMLAISLFAWGLVGLAGRFAWRAFHWGA